LFTIKSLHKAKPRIDAAKIGDYFGFCKFLMEKMKNKGKK
jgi:hypothetical protein